MTQPLVFISYSQKDELKKEQLLAQSQGHSAQLQHLLKAPFLRRRPEIGLTDMERH